MSEDLIPPLRKKRPDGTLYTRLPSTNEKLSQLLRLTAPEITARCAVVDPKNSEFISSECLVHLVRQHRSKPFDSTSETLFKTLMERLLQQLPNGRSLNGEGENLTEANIRDEARYRFLEMLMKDRQEYVENLDVYEVRFEMTVRTLRLDALRKVHRVEKPLDPIETDAETGEIADHVESAAAANHCQIDWRRMGESDSLLRLDEAIDSLPELQKAIIEMDRKEIPVESKEPGVVNMAAVLGRTSKTIRTHRKLAYETLWRALTKGE